MSKLHELVRLLFTTHLPKKTRNVLFICLQKPCLLPSFVTLPGNTISNVVPGRLCQILLCPYFFISKGYHAFGQQKYTFDIAVDAGGQSHFFLIIRIPIFNHDHNKYTPQNRCIYSLITRLLTGTIAYSGNRLLISNKEDHLSYLCFFQPLIIIQENNYT